MAEESLASLKEEVEILKLQMKSLEGHLDVLIGLIKRQHVILEISGRSQELDLPIDEKEVRLKKKEIIKNVSPVAHIMENMGYSPGSGLGKYQTGMIAFPEKAFVGQLSKNGLGYEEGSSSEGPKEGLIKFICKPMMILNEADLDVERIRIKGLKGSTHNQPRKFSKLNAPLSVIMEELQQIDILRSRHIKEGVTQMRNDICSFCDFHRIKGHRTDNCIALRHQIQDLIESRELDDPKVK